MSMNVTSTPRPRRFFSYRTCPECSFAFTPQAENERICRLCTVRLSYQARAPKPDADVPQLPMRECDGPGCIGLFTPRNSRARYCSNACSNRAYRQRKEEAAHGNRRECIRVPS